MNHDKHRLDSLHSDVTESEIMKLLFWTSLDVTGKL